VEANINPSELEIIHVYDPLQDRYICGTRDW
jgi:hypothetical protein